MLLNVLRYKQCSYRPHCVDSEKTSSENTEPTDTDSFTECGKPVVMFFFQGLLIFFIKIRYIVLHLPIFVLHILKKTTNCPEQTTLSKRIRLLLCLFCYVSNNFNFEQILLKMKRVCFCPLSIYLDFKDETYFLVIQQLPFHYCFVGRWRTINFCIQELAWQSATLGHSETICQFIEHLSTVFTQHNT